MFDSVGSLDLGFIPRPLRSGLKTGHWGLKGRKRRVGLPILVGLNRPHCETRDCARVVGPDRDFGGDADRSEAEASVEARPKANGVGRKRPRPDLNAPRRSQCRLELGVLLPIGPAMENGERWDFWAVDVWMFRVQIIRITRTIMACWGTIWSLDSEWMPAHVS